MAEKERTPILTIQLPYDMNGDPECSVACVELRCDLCDETLQLRQYDIRQPHSLLLFTDRLQRFLKTHDDCARHEVNEDTPSLPASTQKQ